MAPFLRRVINVTSILTDFGSVPPATNERIGQSYSNLQLDLDAGQRGQRFIHIEELLCILRATLEEILALYLDQVLASREIPARRMLAIPACELQERCRRLAKSLAQTLGERSKCPRSFPSPTLVATPSPNRTARLSAGSDADENVSRGSCFALSFSAHPSQTLPGDDRLLLDLCTVPSEEDPLLIQNSQNWREFIKKVWEADSLAYPMCASGMKIICSINETEVNRKVLEHLGLWETPVEPAPPDLIPELN